MRGSPPPPAGGGQAMLVVKPPARYIGERKLIYGVPAKRAVIIYEFVAVLGRCNYPPAQRYDTGFTR